MDAQTTLVFVILFGTAAIGCTLVVLSTWVLRRRVPPVAGGWAVATACLLMLSLLVAADGAADGAAEPEYRGRRYNTAGHRAAEKARVNEMRQWISPALEQYRKGHGVYPPTLEAAGIGTPMTRYGPLYYYSSGSRGDPWYLLSFGDIETHRFSADWDSRTQKWTIISFTF